jgi:hypothetical protein
VGGEVGGTVLAGTVTSVVRAVAGETVVVPPVVHPARADNARAAAGSRRSNNDTTVKGRMRAASAGSDGLYWAR